MDAGALQVQLLEKLYQFRIKGTYLLRESPSILSLGWLWVKSKVVGAGTEKIERWTEEMLRTSFTENERNYFRQLINDNEISPWALPFSFFRLPNRLEYEIFRCYSIERLHEARVEMVKNHLPPAKRILDIGGAAKYHPEGALLYMGYPHAPEEVVIVDLPDGYRNPETQGIELKDTEKGSTKVRYIFSDFTKLTPLSENHFDLVWSGQSIEHISEASVRTVLHEALRVLKPGGSLCLDTPNRRLTRLISEEYLHPDHKKEYLPTEFASILREVGFEKVEMKAVTPLPISLRLGRISKLEILKETHVGPNAETGFSFFAHAKKPK